MSLQFVPNTTRGGFREGDRHRVAKLPHRLGPCPVKNIVIRKHLESGAFSHAKVSHLPVRVRQHVLPARHPMIAGLEGLGRLVKRAPGMALVTSSSRIEFVIVIFPRGFFLRVGQIRYRVAHRQPGRIGRVLAQPLQALHPILESGGEGAPLALGNLVPLPIAAVNRLVPQ